MHGDCERARGWVSVELDRELSELEQVGLSGHLAGCEPCRTFRTALVGLTTELRAAPLEPLEGFVEIGRIRRRVPFRLAPAAAALAVAAVGLGSVLTSSGVRTGSETNARAQPVSVSPGAVDKAANPDTINLRTMRALEQPQAQQPVTARQFRGGPVR